MPTITRKEFLQASTATIAVASTALAARPVHAVPERIRYALIGSGGQGTNHAKVFSSFDDCEVVAVCDVDPERREKLAQALPNTDTVRQEEDYRRIIEDESIQCVSIATPDHWHTPVALAALKAGKHVYVEKPCSHTVKEGDALAAAMVKTGLCVQHGTQWRASKGLREGLAFMADGGLGKVRVAKAINHQFRPGIGRAPVSEPPAGVNYDLWLGPAPKQPFSQNRWHYNWHWHWDYGGGDMANDGIHQVDVARWGLGVQLPVTVSAAGGQLFYDDDHETPDTQVVTFEYDTCHLIYEMRLWTDYPLEGHTNGVVFYGDKGTLHVGREAVVAKVKGEEDRVFEGVADLPGHIRNFLDCVREGTPEKLNAPITDCVHSSHLCNLGNLATRVRRRLHYDAAAGHCIDDHEATDMLTKHYREGYELPVVG